MTTAPYSESGPPARVPDQLGWQFPGPFLSCLEPGLLMALSVLCLHSC